MTARDTAAGTRITHGAILGHAGSVAVVIGFGHVVVHPGDMHHDGTPGDAGG